MLIPRTSGLLSLGPHIFPLCSFNNQRAQRMSGNYLLSHYSATGDTIPRGTPYSARLQGQAFLRYLSSKGLSLDCGRAFLGSGGVAAIVCDATEDTVRQRRDRCLAIGGVLRSGQYG